MSKTRTDRTDWVVLFTALIAILAVAVVFTNTKKKSSRHEEIPRRSQSPPQRSPHERPKRPSPMIRSPAEIQPGRGESNVPSTRRTELDAVHNVRDLRRWAKLALHHDRVTDLLDAWDAIKPSFGTIPRPTTITARQIEPVIQARLRATLRGSDPTPYHPTWMPPANPFYMDVVRDLVVLVISLSAVFSIAGLILLGTNANGNGPVGDNTLLTWITVLSVILLVIHVVGLAVLFIPAIHQTVDSGTRRIGLVGYAIGGLLTAVAIYLVQGTDAHMNPLEVYLWCAFSALSVGSFIAAYRAIQD